MSAKKDFDFGPLKPTKKSLIDPISKNGKISRLAVYQKLQEVIRYTAEHGVTPFEEALEIDLESPQVKEEAKKLGIKGLSISILSRIRKELKSSNIKDIEVIQRDHGKKIYLVGKE